MGIFILKRLAFGMVVGLYSLSLNMTRFLMVYLNSTGSWVAGQLKRS